MAQLITFSCTRQLDFWFFERFASMSGSTGRANFSTVVCSVRRGMEVDPEMEYVAEHRICSYD